ncbi:hypothetical protein EJ04DRAFT_79256 [Polyplosphaeria fusca]|uniref:Tr-type G domain-containing protein n=1 Tax=Polyplosphaeria fusca TaxID=682080 RepID=A0A9P4R738_9PLEO|nr:hypothetical protein EJ04DRAFT_79256 [Polyplosphaeria fusca]
MASIFTFDPDPPRVSSPWERATPPIDARSISIPQDLSDSSQGSPALTRATAEAHRDSNVTRLEAEPQDGPTEYKLHLLLRPRGSYNNTSAALTQSRQHRLEQLTTQLLWRLQQSCSYHISSSTAPVLPHFPDEAELSSPTVPRRLFPGLEDSKGALYEIGVADDGTFVGLAMHEMEESFSNLRAMAASLGCRVDVLRMVSIGESQSRTQLWVAEAHVRPDQHLFEDGVAKNVHMEAEDSPANPTRSPQPPEQMRVSLTGATMSGKSSLLGSLSTATLDNGRGKSRLSLLKHRHEIASGMTSSVTQELIGYRDVFQPCGSARTASQVISFGAGNVSSWIDIHASAEGGRLIFISDSAGHPRFRRTTVRGLVGWDPDFTLLCIPADNTENSSGRVGASPSSQEILGPAAADVDLSRAHLQLCLSLELPLLVIITKLDIATKNGLRQTLAKVLSTLKESGRKPYIVSDASTAVSEADLSTIPAHELMEAEKVVHTLKADPLAIVPIILTSALKGTGIIKLHAILRELPLTVNPALPKEGLALDTLFHIEDVYRSTTDERSISGPGTEPVSRSFIIGGHLRYGTLRLGDELTLGPYPADISPDDSDSGSGRDRSRRHPSGPTSRSFPGALYKGHPGPSALQSSSYTPNKEVEWRRVRITSIRNLRLPVSSLHAGQVGTLGITPLNPHELISSPALVRIRKGMIVANGKPKANRVFTVCFKGLNAQAVRGLSVGSAVVVYVASVRASAKIVSVAAVATESTPFDDADQTEFGPEDDQDAFGFGGFDEEESVAQAPDSPTATAVNVVFQFLGCREFVETGAKILILPGGGPGLFGGTERGEKGVAGLEGYVGHVVEEQI